jgi:hypothetical protein
VDGDTVVKKELVGYTQLTAEPKDEEPLSLQHALIRWRKNETLFHPTCQFHAEGASGASAHHNDGMMKTTRDLPLEQ